jgi:mRNA interferase MazF
MKQGEIRWYIFKYPDKKRPVLILTRTSIIDYLSELSIAPITSTIREIPSEVYITTNDGLPKDCAVNLDHVQTVSKEKIGALITTLSKTKMEKVKEALLFAFDF